MLKQGKDLELFLKIFLSSDLCRVALLEFIRQLEVCTSTQSKVDEWYNPFCDMLVEVIDKCQPTMSNQNKVKKRRHLLELPP